MALLRHCLAELRQARGEWLAADALPLALESGRAGSAAARVVERPKERPRTRWCTPSGRPEFGARPAAADAARCADALLASLRTSVRRGYRKAAIRHYLMLRACGGTVPAGDAARCSEYLSACPEPELRKIQERVGAWAAMAGYGGRLAPEPGLAR